MWTAVLIGWDPATPPPSPRVWVHIRVALLVSEDRRQLLVTPCPRDTNKALRVTRHAERKKLSELAQHSIYRGNTEGRYVATSSTGGSWFGYWHKQRNLNTESVFKETNTHCFFSGIGTSTPWLPLLTQLKCSPFLTFISSFFLCHR